MPQMIEDFYGPYMMKETQTKCILEYLHLIGPKPQKQIVLDGPVRCGKSIALIMLVHWARVEGWLVLYVPKGRQWTHGGFFYRNQQTGLWDTLVQAASILQAKANSYCFL
ncbi:hypothetical protein POM88_034316 [Heracleum sosnowskyi]|uniref:Small ribosomal subunit protein mS29 n=1 Tax=Heracleum sosnowskyi TaxID=360622 RepID=A0AAD8MD15_9APIA|nr:hypothetical protein POM88_034316 [Heracleum sosnowskyi]